MNEEVCSPAGTMVLNLLKKFPPQIKYIVGNEACERFSFYGMRSILVVFMTQHLLMAKENATAVFHLFVSACYFLPLVGAFLSDRFWGKYKTIMLLSSVYCLGHGVLALWENEMGLFVGLALVAVGTGGIKPCVSAHVGDQFSERNKHLVKDVFDIFYFAINFGSFFSTLLIPVLLTRLGARVAFGLPGVLMLVATVIFWMGRHLYVHVPPSGVSQPGFLTVVWMAARRYIQGVRPTSGQSFFDLARPECSQELIEGSQSAFNIFKVFIFISGFWALFDQHSSSWILQAQQMNLQVGSTHWEASQIAALNPIMVMILIPLFSGVIYPWLSRRGIQMHPLRRMTWGMFVTAFSFVFVGVYQQLLDSGVSLSILWHILPFLLLTAGEVMISITGLEFAYTQAPLFMKSTIMSFWLLTTFFGNMLTASIAKINIFQGAAFFYFFALFISLLGGGFYLAARQYKVSDHFAKA